MCSKRFHPIVIQDPVGSRESTLRTVTSAVVRCASFASSTRFHCSFAATVQERSRHRRANQTAPAIVVARRADSVVACSSKVGGQLAAIVPKRYVTHIERATLLRINAGVASFGFRAGFASMDYLLDQFRFASRH
jgi:hypothetical protein